MGYLDTNEKVENQGYDPANNTTTLRFNGINAESLSVKLKLTEYRNRFFQRKKTTYQSIPIPQQASSLST